MIIVMVMLMKKVMVMDLQWLLHAHECCDTPATPL
jgi:hypothetical protein